jgi:hypothetical protein
MLNLIRKDLLMHRTGFPVYVPFLVGVMALQAWRGFSLSVYIILICVYAVIVPGALMAIEDRVRAGVFNCSLPVTRSQIAGAKYVLAWGLAVVFVLTGLVIFWMIRAQNWWAIWTLSTANLALAILSIGLGLTLPFMLRLGWLGTMVFYFAILTLVFLTALIVLAFVPGEQLVDSIIAGSEFVAQTAAQLGELNSLMLIVVVGTLFNLVSYKLAVMLFRQREF